MENQEKSQEKSIVHLGQTYEKPAETNFGQLVQILTDRYDRKTRTDAGQVEWSEYPVDQMLSEALMAIVAKLSKVHGLKASTQKKIRQILPRLNYHLELGIAINGGPDAVATRFDTEVVAQVETDVKNLADEHGVTPQKVWQLPAARLLVSLMNDVKQRALELDEPVQQVKMRDNGRVNTHKVVLEGILVDGRRSMERLLNWKIEGYEPPMKNLRPRDIAYLKHGKELLEREGHRLSASEKMPIRNPDETKMPWEVQSSAAEGTELCVALTTQYALFLIGKENAAWLDSDELQEAFGHSAALSEQWEGTEDDAERQKFRDEQKGRFKAHLKRQFRMTDEELASIDSELNNAMRDVNPDAVNHEAGRYNSIWFHPYRGKVIEKRIETLTTHGASSERALKVIKAVDDASKDLQITINEYHRGVMDAGQFVLRISHEFDSHAAEILFAQRHLSPEDFQKALPELKKGARDELAIKLLRELDPSFKEDEKETKDHFFDRLVRMMEIDYGIVEGNDADYDWAYKEMCRLLEDEDPKEVNQVINENPLDVARMLTKQEVLSGTMDFTAMRRKVTKETWQKMFLGSHVLFRDGEYDDPNGIRPGNHCLPWSRQSSVSNDYLYKYLEEEPGDLEKAMKKFSEKEIFYWLHGEGEKVGEAWKAYEKKRKRFFDKVRRMKKKLDSEAQ